MFRLESAKIVGTATKDSWSQTHLFFPSDQEKKKRRGDLLAVLSLKGLAEGIEAVAAGREIISRLHEEYYGDLQQKPLPRLKKAVEKVRSEASLEAEVEIGAAVVVGKVLYLAITGKGQAVLRRNGQVGVLVKGNEKIVTASGYLKEGDLFLLGTNGFFKTVAMGVLRAALATDSPEEAVEAAAPIIHGQPQSGTAAAVVVKIKKDPLAIKEKTVEKEAMASSELDQPPLIAEKQGPKQTKITPGIWLARFFSFLQKHLGKKTIYLKLPKVNNLDWQRFRKKGKPERSPKTIFTVILVLLLLLGISVGLGARQRERLGLKEKTAVLLEEARSKKEEGEALLELNPSRARELLLEAQDLVTKIEDEGLDTEEFVDFKRELQQALNQVLKEHQAEVTVAFDLELIKQEASGSDLAVSGNKILVLDKAKASVYEIDISEKKQAILAGGKSIADPFQIAAFLPKVFVLTRSGIVEIDRLTKKERLVIDTDNQWGKILDFWAFSGNLYLLDEAGEIWQYPAVETGFGSRRGWLKKDSFNLTNVVSMAIDGSIWLLKADGVIWKFTRGEKDAFGIAGLDKPFSNPTCLYTDDDLENLYLLDKGNSRVVVLAKTGEYQASYLWERVSGIDKIMASEEEGKIWLLGGSKIYEIEIK